MPRDIPIMFSEPMILGLDREACEQGTGKSMTSRLAWRPDGFTKSGTARIGAPSPWQRVQVGDRLWVRENFWRYGYWVSKKKAGKVSLSFRGLGDPLRDPEVLIFAAGTAGPSDAGYPTGKVGQREPAWHLRPNIFLPRAESRFTLVITDTKIRRLRDISDVECEQEGVRWKRDGVHDTYWVEGLKPETYTTYSYQECFKSLWNHLHGAGAWESNPEIVAMRFTVHKQNIDKLAA